MNSFLFVSLIVSACLFWLLVFGGIIFAIKELIKGLIYNHNVKKERKERQLLNYIRESVRLGISDYKLDEICHRRKK